MRAPAGIISSSSNPCLIEVSANLNISPDWVIEIVRLLSKKKDQLIREANILTRVIIEEGPED
jgi:hypothetical protein